MPMLIAHVHVNRSFDMNLNVSIFNLNCFDAIFKTNPPHPHHIRSEEELEVEIDSQS
jgi:hypothetical protein